MTTVNVHEAKTQLSRLLDRAHAGEEIVIAKAGTPYARLVPLQTPRPRALGRYRDRDGTVPNSFFEPLDEAELASWEGGGCDPPARYVRVAVGVGGAGEAQRPAPGLLQDPHNQIWVSAASAWEIATKHRIGKYPAGGAIIAEWNDRIARDGFRQLDMSCAHALRAGSLPGEHRDPFDRMIAAQGIMETIRVATPDPAIATLGADTIW